MQNTQTSRLCARLAEPAGVDVYLEDGFHALRRNGDVWEGSGVEVEIALKSNAGPVRIALRAPSVGVLSVRIRWNYEIPSGSVMLGDAWERSYGELEWRPLDPARPLPWYFLWVAHGTACGIGLETGPSSFGHWIASRELLTLSLDVRAGTQPVRLGARELAAASLTGVEGAAGESAYEVARRLCKAMCAQPRLARSPIYGFNDWYYAYGNNSAEGILRDTETLAELTQGLMNRPFSVIDDGWQKEKASDGGPWDQSQPEFPDMPELASKIKAMGCRPGVWFRPLLSSAAEGLPKSWFRTGFTLDPTIPEVLEKVRKDMRVFRQWGFELVKHDYSTFDMFGLWGFDLSTKLYAEGVRFEDSAKTTAEAVRDLYRAIRDGAGDMLLIGCNTVSHLAAGLHEIMRIGDDTSGAEWARTRKMGVNTLAFRAVHEGTFYAADADCAPITDKVPWKLTEQWLRLVGESGTPLFVSADPKALTREARAALKGMLKAASEPQPVAEPLDWLETKTPTRWRLRNREVQFNWSEADGA